MDFMATAKEICVGSAVGVVLGVCIVAVGYKLKPLWDKVTAIFSAPDNNELFPGIKKVNLPSYKDLKKKPPMPL